MLWYPRIYMYCRSSSIIQTEPITSGGALPEAATSAILPPAPALAICYDYLICSLVSAYSTSSSVR